MKTNRIASFVDTTEGRLVRLPDAPRTKSPVPWLTSIHAAEGRGPYGDSRYRGNCSGLLIRDLLLYYRPQRVFDPMSGGGTCRDVCRELDITCISSDLHRGFDVTAPECFLELGEFDVIWLHPPYWNMIHYGDSPQCLSNAPSLKAFCDSLRLAFRHCGSVLARHGHLCVLMGDGKFEGRYMGLPFRTFAVAEEEGFHLAAPEIVRFSHGATSAGRSYSFSFIPRLHDICMVFRHDSAPTNLGLKTFEQKKLEATLSHKSFLVTKDNACKRDTPEALRVRSSIKCKQHSARVNTELEGVSRSFANIPFPKNTSVLHAVYELTRNAQTSLN